ncbi:MAG: chemotaxis response regulator protein-glutamate methylesterase [Thermoanaerobaculales bacterium]|nr:chemotaxis response regulator protein-glutamate methylesterase [Thermoanaerobaculales bacterium]
MTRPARILVVDDSVVARRIISDILDGEEGIEVVGSAANGRIALAKIPRLAPDLITLDIDMPEMDGLEMLSQVRTLYPSIKVVMLSNLTVQGAAATVESLFRGAADYVTKASGMVSPEAASLYLREQLVPKIRALLGLGGGSTRGSTRKGRHAVDVSAGGPPEVVAIGVSTGGPNALRTVLCALPPDFGVPIVIVQHMPKDFTRYLADRLDAQCSIRISEAENGVLLKPGQAWIAPGGNHMLVEPSEDAYSIITNTGPLVNSCRPSVDVLFSSVVGCFGSGVLAVVLTGMGQDGLHGCEEIHRAGGCIVAQDQASSVVWGMPGQVVAAGIAEATLPVDEIGPEIVRRVEGSQS